MRAQLEEALDNGALGLSSGLAYGSAFNAPPEEVQALAEPLAECGRALHDAHAHRVRRDSRRDGRGVSRRPSCARAGGDFASEVRGAVELGAQHGSAEVARDDARRPAGRLRLLSVQPQFVDARSEAGHRRHRHHDHLVDAASGDGGQADPRSRRRMGASASRKRRSACSRRARCITTCRKTTCGASSRIPRR